MELFKKGTLHRDVSPYNVLFGNPGAGTGHRGILIDFDIAIRRNWNKPADGQIVSSAFVSQFFWTSDIQFFQGYTLVPVRRCPE
jgi:serine/threonine protein kinase